MTRRVFSKSLLALSLGLTLVGSAVAQTYPSRPITMVVPWGAGAEQTLPPASWQP